MKPASMVYGVAGGLSAVLGFCLVVGSLLILCFGVPFNEGGLLVSGLAGLYLFYRGSAAFRSAFAAGVREEEEDYRSIEDRLDELERLKRRDLVTPEEYAAKRLEILRDL
jgi:hypothetical protein